MDWGHVPWFHFVQQLGVTVLVDDPLTMDFHAGLLFHHQGWPGLVEQVLREKRKVPPITNGQTCRNPCNPVLHPNYSHKCNNWNENVNA
jgi:hypothetical protein